MAASASAVWAAASKDYDALLFGAPRLVRFLTISGKEFLPSRGTFRPITPEVIDLEHMLATLGITRAQLVDLGILMGTDFNPGVKGVGPKKALALLKRHGTIEQMPPEVREEAGPVEEVRRIYLQPDVTDGYTVEAGPCDREARVRVLCQERVLSQERVRAALQRAFG